jgi:hypothetical protein
MMAGDESIDKGQNGRTAEKIVERRIAFYLVGKRA